MGYMHQPYMPCWTQAWSWIVLNEIEVDPTSTAAAAFIGAGGATTASVEYWIDTGASSPAVTVGIGSGGGTTTWSASDVAPGFHAHRFGPLPRGAKLTLAATNAIARLRWCEPVCC